MILTPILLQPDSDSLTKDDEAGNNDLGVALINDVSGEIVIEYISPAISKSSEIWESDDISVAGPSNIQLSPKTTNAKKSYLTDEKCMWRKVSPVYSKILSVGILESTNAGKFENSFFRQIFAQSLKNFLQQIFVKYIVKDKNYTDLILSSDDIRVFIGILWLSGYHHLLKNITRVKRKTLVWIVNIKKHIHHK